MSPSRKFKGISLIMGAMNMRAIFIILAVMAINITAMAQEIEITPTAVQQDSIGWIRGAIKHGKFDPENDSIAYPKAVRWGWRTFKRVKRAVNEYDSCYVKGFGKKLKVSLKGNCWFDNYDCRIDDITFEFYSSSTNSVGAYVSLLGLSVGYQFGFDQINGVRPRSKKFNIGLTCARFSIDFYRILNSGDMDITIVPDNKEKFRWRDFPGLARRSWGIDAYYFFNNKRYAQSAAYSNSLRQIRNAGSFFAGFSVSHQSFNANPKELPEILFDDDSVVTNEEQCLFNYTDYSANAGYGYNAVLGRHFLLNATMLLYTGVKHANTKSLTDGGNTFWALNAKPRVGLAYNNNLFFASLQGSINTHLFNTGSNRFRSAIYDFSLIAGVRF